MKRDFSYVKRVVVKVGTNLLTTAHGVDLDRIEQVVSDIVQVRSQGVQVLLVSSGAIGLGAKELEKTSAATRVALRQAYAAIGQPLLMYHYRNAFMKHQVVSAQLLLTRIDMNERKTFVNLKNSLDTLLDLEVIPIINENDTISTAEIGTAFGDNDRLSALVASKVDAELLIILTDIDGLYTADPKKERSARLISHLETISDETMALAGSAGSTFSTGGMKTKLMAAKIAQKGGCTTVIASGYEERVLERILAGEPLGTSIQREQRISQRSRWILNSAPKGVIHIDQGAVAALRNHKSLLPSGITRVEGVFKSGDVVMINDFAKAVPYFNSTELIELEGLQSSQIAVKLGKNRSDVIFRPEDIVFLDDEQ